MEYTHPCIKCSASYTDNDPDAYYCPACIDEKKRIAQEIDKKIKSRPRKQYMSPLQAYDAAHKVRGFINANDLL